MSLFDPAFSVAVFASAVMSSMVGFAFSVAAGTMLSDAEAAIDYNRAHKHLASQRMRRGVEPSSISAPLLVSRSWPASIISAFVPDFRKGQEFPGQCNKWLRQLRQSLLPKPSSGTGRCAREATSWHSSPPTIVQAPSTWPASVRLSMCQCIGLPRHMWRPMRARRPPGPFAEPQ